MFDFRNIWNGRGGRRQQESVRRKISRKLARRRLLLESLEERRVMDAAPTKITVNPTGFSNPTDFVDVGSVAFFAANDGTHGTELWKTDGTQAGTTMVADINPGPGGSGPTDLTNVNGTLYFSANDGTDGYQLWKSDGTTAGTVMVDDIYPGTHTVTSSTSGGGSSTVPNSSSPADITAFNGQIYFSAVNASGRQLWTSNGTAAGTTIVNDIFPGTDSSGSGNSANPNSLTVANGKLFFVATNAANGTELWVTDGTSAGTVLVDDINPGTTSSGAGNSSDPTELTNVNNTLFFAANDGTDGTELWKSDGTAAGTTMVKDIFPGSSTSSGSSVPNSSLPTYLTAVGGELFFIANDGTTGQELWKSDGTAAGTVLVTDNTPTTGGNLGYFGDLVNLNGTLIFAGNDGSSGRELWRSDGTAAGTTLVKDINVGSTTSSSSGTSYPNSSYPFYMANINGTVYFTASNSTSGRELWRTDGTAAGTVAIPDIDSGTASSDPQGFVGVNGDIVFSATGDGNTQGTDRDVYSEPAATGAVQNQTGTFRLTIYVNDTQVTIPANVGVESDGDNATVTSTDATGDLSYNSPNTPLLGDFFNIWQNNGGEGGNNANAVLTSSDLMGNITNSTHALTMFVNGQVSTDFSNLQIQSGDNIVLDYTDNPVISLNTNFGSMVVELYQNSSTVSGDTTPITVANFLSYVDSGAYNNTFFNRSVSDFVIQGGYATTSSPTFSSTSQFTVIPTNAAIVNEPGIPNTLGTIAMAKTSDPNSATDQFFVNTADNSTSLDDPSNSGGFTVFGKVLDLTAVNTISALPIQTEGTDPNYSALPLSSTNQLAVIQSVAGDGEVTGTVYDDTNSNGKLDSGEKGVAGITVYVDANNSGSFVSSDISTTTDANGNYLLNLAPGTYTIRTVPATGAPSGAASEPADISVTVQVGTITSTQNFGLIPADVPPTAANYTFTVSNTATAAPLNVLTNDLGISGSTTGLTITAVTQSTQGGTVAIDSTNKGDVDYTPTSGFTGTDTFSYTITDSNGLTSTGTVTLDVTSPTAAPTAANYSFTVANTATAQPFNVLLNDKGVSGSSTGLTVTAVTQGSGGGTVAFTSSGVTYTPKSGFVGTDTFTYTITDTNSETSTGTVTVDDVTPTAPTAANYSYTVSNTASAFPLNVLLNDKGVSGSSTGLTVTAVTQGTEGGTVAIGSSGSGVTYTAKSGFVGTDTFTYTITDTSGLTSIGTVTVDDITGTPPTAANYTFTVVNNVTATPFNVLLNDKGVSGSSTGLTVTAVTQGSAGGTVAFTSTGVTYTPKSGFIGTDTFTYTVTDTTGLTGTGTVTVTDESSTATPTAANYTFTVLNNVVAQPFNVLLNDSGVSGSSTGLTVTAITQGSQGGTVAFTSAGVTYTPKSGFIGTDTFTYTITDTNGKTATGTVTVTDQDSTLANTVSGVIYIDANHNGSQDSNEPGIPGVEVTLTNPSLTSFTPETQLTGPNGTYSFPSLPSGTYTVTEAEPTALIAGTASTTATGATTTTNVISNITVAGGQTVSNNDFSAASVAPSYINITWFFASAGTSSQLLQKALASAATNAGDTALAASIADGSTTLFTNINAVADSYTVAEGGTLTTTTTNGVLANDVDPDGKTMTAVLGTTTADGTLTLNSNGTFTYTPTASFTGTDSFTYTATDGSLTSAVTKVTITVDSSSTITTIADSYTATAGQELTVSTANGVLHNDFDPTSGATMTATLGTTTTHGTLTLNADGSFDYTPTSGYTGTDTFTYTATDGTLTSAATTTTITVTGATTPSTITATADSYSVIAGQTLTTTTTNGVLANDTDSVSGKTLTATLDQNVSHGTLAFSANGTFTYTPTSGYTGTDTFTYTDSDGTTTSAPATVTITVDSSTAITANPDTFAATAGQTLTVTAANGVLANDVDPTAGATMTAKLITNTAHGTLTLNSDGSLTYVPNSGFTGTDTFQYQATDGTLTSSTVTDTITVKTNIIANADSFTAISGQTLTVAAASGVLANDVDPTSGATMTAKLISSTTDGTLTLNSDGSLTYVSDSGFTGTDSFTYEATDGTLTSTVTTDTITVNPNIVANPSSFTATENQTLNVIAANGVLHNAVDPTAGATVTAQLVTSTTHGTLTLNADGSLTYVPNSGFTGTDTFTYKATDGTLTSATTTDTITVTAATITANPDTYTAIEGQTLSVPVATGVLANDIDPTAGATMTANVISTTVHGTLTLNANGSFTYVPGAGFTGTDTFTYQATDGTLTSATTTDTITVNAPTIVATADTYTATAGSTLFIPVANGVLANDVDQASGQTMTASVVSSTTHGTLTLNSNGSLSYTPDSGFTGVDTFSYQATDGTRTSAATIDTITVEAPPQTIATTPTTYTVIAGQTLNTTAANGVLANDVDPTGAAMTATLVSNTTHGTLILNSNGSVAYTPNGGFTGSDTFTYTAGDGSLTSPVTTVTINVDPISSITANVDNYTVAAGQTLTVPAATGVLANDIDPTTGATMTANIISTTSHGTLTLNSDGSLTYTPNSGFTGPDTFTYQDTDGTLSSADITDTITVDPSTAITTKAETYNVTEGFTLTVPVATGVLANAFDPTLGATMTAEVISPTINGSLELNPNGSFTYTPKSGFAGTDSFVYQAGDGTLTSETTTVTISVTPNIVTTPDAYTVTAGQTLTVPVATGVLANDIDPTQGATMTANVITTTPHGTLTLNSNGSLTYVPNSGFTGTDTFTYQATDGTLTSPITTDTITVVAVTPKITATADTYATIEGQTLNVPTASGVLSNDTDTTAGATMTATLISTTANGALELSPDGSFTYTPTSSTFIGTDTFTYEATDGTLTSTPTTVTIHVDSSSAITTTPSTYSVVAGQTLNTTATNGVLENDIDPTSGATMTANLGTNAANGTLQLNADGSFTYTPTTGFTGTDTFTYTATDGTLTSNLTTVTINVTAATQPPVAVADSYSGPSGQPLAISATDGVLSNDTTAAGTTLTATLSTEPEFGTVVLNSNGSFTYTPNAGFDGKDSFTYTASNGTQSSAPATVNILIDTAPTAVADSYSITAGSVLNETAATGVLANDTASGNNPLTATLLVQPAHGVLNFNKDGSFTYTPNESYTGTDVFTYEANDGFLNSTPTNVTITVNAVPDQPVTQASSYNVAPNGTLTTTAANGVLANDSDPLGKTLTAQLESTTTHGTLALATDGSFTYTPNASFTGTDSFTYVATNGTSSSPTTTATIVVDNLPTANNVSYTIGENGVLTATAATGVLANATPGAGNSNPLTAILESTPTNGTLTFNANGSFVYTPATGFTGSDSFTYVISDGIGVTATLTASINVTATNHAPVAANDSFSAQVGGSLKTTAANGVLANDTDADNNILTAHLVTGPTNGTLTLNPDGSFTYNPNTTFHGTDTFTYEANDGLVNSNVATVTISVNTLPVANADAYSATAGTTLTVPLATGVLANDVDADGLPMTAALVKTTTDGALTLNSNGSLTYVPNTGFTGNDTFTYTASDAFGTSTPATVTITVAAVSNPAATPAVMVSDQDANDIFFTPAVEGEVAQYASNVDQVFTTDEDWSPTSKVV